ncbi:MAG: cupin domain-containing protein [Myxococcales bacterium]|nr:cupin domain-containing protein [Myxococcales bacterium]
MAVLRFLDSADAINDEEHIRDFLGKFGVIYERWPIPAGISELVGHRTALTDGEKQLCLDALREKLDELNQTEGYCQADIVVLHPETPNLDVILAKFDKVHLHTDDEVRFILDGRGVFGFSMAAGAEPSEFTLEVSTGEYIVVPANTWHWFELCEDKRIKAVRIFKDMAGWVPHYRNDVNG